MIHDATGTDMNKNRHLRTVELQLRSRYQEMRRRIQPTYKVSSKSDKVWEKTADTVVAMEADPYDYVDAQFQYSLSLYPWPNNMSGSQAQANYEKYMVLKPGRPEQVVECQASYVRNMEERLGCQADDVVLNSPIELYAWFRCLACSEEALPAVLARYEKQAREQIEGDSRLRNYLETHYERRIKLIFGEKVPAIPAGPPTAVSEDDQPVGDWQCNTGRLSDRHPQGCC